MDMALDGKDSPDLSFPESEAAPCSPKKCSMSIYDPTTILYKSCRFVISFAPIIMVLTVSVPGVIAYFYHASRQEPDCKRFPLISHMGTYPPMSCFFTLFVALGAFIMTVIVAALHYIILFQVPEDSNRHEKSKCCLPQVKILNDFAVVLGFVAALGVVFIGAFQASEMSALHNVGVCLFVGPGTVYMMVIAWITRIQEKKIIGMEVEKKISGVVGKIIGGIIGRILLIVRVCFIFITIVTGVLFFFYLETAKTKWTGIKGIDTKSRWCPRYGGFEDYETSAKLEVTFFSLFLAFILTLQVEFYQHPRTNEKASDQASPMMSGNIVTVCE